MLNGLYDAELHGLDSQLARLLTWIDERYGEDAVIIVTSDHGEELGEAGRVGHEYGLSQTLLHVPLFVRSPALSAGTVDEVVNIQHLYNFIDAVATGESTDIDALIGVGKYHHVAERYPSGYNTSLGRGYDRPWVCMFDGRYKGLGPSEEGFDLYDIEVLGFGTDAETSNPAIGDLMKTRIDDYWMEHEDRREETQRLESLSEEELKRLRSLGYVD